MTGYYPISNGWFIYGDADSNTLGGTEMIYLMVVQWYTWIPNHEFEFMCEWDSANDAHESNM